MMNSTPHGCLTVAEAAERIGCSPNIIRKRMRSGKIRFVQICGIGTRYPLIEDIDRAIHVSDNNPVESIIATRIAQQQATRLCIELGLMPDKNGKYRNTTKRKRKVKRGNEQHEA